VHPVSDLAGFLAARLDEIEAAAREAASRPLGDAWDDGTRLTAVARHIARHDPARVLREVEAKRKILRRCEARINELDVHPNGLVSPRAVLARQIIAELAAVFSDHPDYRQEWAP
jgi:Family of unknown function (DUF6221)